MSIVILKIVENFRLFTEKRGKHSTMTGKSARKKAADREKRMAARIRTAVSRRTEKAAVREKREFRWVRKTGIGAYFPEKTAYKARISLKRHIKAAQKAQKLKNSSKASKTM